MLVNIFKRKQNNTNLGRIKLIEYKNKKFELTPFDRHIRKFNNSTINGLSGIFTTTNLVLCGVILSSFTAITWLLGKDNIRTILNIIENTKNVAKNQEVDLQNLQKKKQIL